MEPKVRFKGFSGEWNVYTIGDIAPVMGGYAFQSEQFSNSGIAIVRISNILDTGIIGGDFVKYDIFTGDTSFRLYSGDILIAMSGATTGKVAIVKTDKFLYQNQRVGKFSRTDKINYSFLASIVGSNKFRLELNKRLTSSAQPNASSRDIDSIQQYLPNDIIEQGTIASFFSSIDSTIISSAKKLASLKKLKSASLVTMFPQNGESTPKVRFKGFEGEWRRIKFGTISSRVTRRNDTLECKFPLTISANEGLISQEKFFNNIVASSNLGNYYLLKRGEFAYNKSYSNGYPFGAIKRLDKYDSGVLSPLYICFGIHDEVDSDYICSFFETTLWHKDIAERATEGARNHGILNIGTEDFFDINIMIPKSKEEQQSIATFFRSLDRKIALETARLEKLKQIKLACLDKMFV